MKNPPVKEKLAVSRQNCSICSKLNDYENCLQNRGHEERDSFLPVIVANLKMVKDFTPGDDSRSRQLKQCPECSTYYLYQTDHEFLLGGSEDGQKLTRLTDREALPEILKLAREDTSSLTVESGLGEYVEYAYWEAINKSVEVLIRIGIDEPELDNLITALSISGANNPLATISILEKLVGEHSRQDVYRRLIKELNSPNPQIRSGVIYALENSLAEEDVPQIIACLEDLNPLVQVAAGKVLRRFGKLDLAVVLDSRNLELKIKTITSFQPSAFPPSFKSYREIVTIGNLYSLKSSGTRLRLAVIKCLKSNCERNLTTNFNEEEIRQLRVTSKLALDDPEKEIRDQAIDLFCGVWSYEEQNSLLIERLKIEPDNLLRSKLMRNMHGPAAVELLIEYLTHENEDTRSDAAWELGLKSDKRAIEPLIQALQDPACQYRAFEALAKLNAREAVPQLKKLSMKLKAEAELSSNGFQKRRQLEILQELEQAIDKLQRE